MAFGGVVDAAGGADDGAGTGVGIESCWGRVLSFLLDLDNEEDLDDLDAEGEDVLADFLLGGPELSPAVCLWASRPVRALSTAPGSVDFLCEDGVLSAPRLLCLGDEDLPDGVVLELPA